MKKQILIIVALLIIQFNGFAQKNINNYKYIIVPKSYGFLGDEDKFQLNSLTKFLFNKYGYTAFFTDDELPQDLIKNSCLALFTDVVEDKGLFKTKLRIDLKDCGGNIVMSSEFGETREKEYAKAYNLALRGAFETYKNMDYKYEPIKEESTQSVVPMQSESVVVEDKISTPIQTEVKPSKEEVTKAAVAVEVAEMATPEPQITIEDTKIELIEEAKGTLYAQPIDNGFQLIDTTPKVVMILLKTAQSNVYIVKDQDAIVYKEEGKWFISKTNGDKVSIEALNIKF